MKERTINFLLTSLQRKSLDSAEDKLKATTMKNELPTTSENEEAKFGRETKRAEARNKGEHNQLPSRILTIRKKVWIYAKTQDTATTS